MGEEVIAEFEKEARDAPAVQNRLLSSIISANASCLYLQPYALDALSDAHTFKARVPIVEYEAIRPLVERIADGDTSPILTSSPISFFLLSSGTSGGRPRMVPGTADLWKIYSKSSLIDNAIRKRDFSTDYTGKMLLFQYAGKLLTTKGGLKAGAASAHFARREDFSSSFLTHCTSPVGVVLGEDVRQSMYCHLLCGLLQATEVTVIASFLAYGITEGLRLLEDVWEELSNDICSGTLSKRIVDDSIRTDVSTCLRCDPQLAEKVRAECAKGRWSGIIKRLWPNVKYISTVVTGAMEPYVPYLKHYAGDVPILGGGYGSSECVVGRNLSLLSPPEQVTFTLVPFAAYFEFLPLSHEEKEDVTSDITGLEVGKEYELIVTTVAGLYRYRLGDVIRITGFYHALPQFAFVGRKNVVLSINTDKTDEQELCELVKQASTRLKDINTELIDFTSHADHSSRPGHYTIYWELRSGVGVEDSVLLQCCKDIDSHLNDPYQRGRAAGTIGPLKLCILKAGTFQNLMSFMVALGTSPTQYKTPRCVKSEDLVNILRQSSTMVYTSSP